MEQRNIDLVLARIAPWHRRVRKLETRQSDSLNFYDPAVWNLKEALVAAYQAGVEADMTITAAA